MTAAQAQEAEALLCLSEEASIHLVEAPEPSETSHDTARSCETLKFRQPAHSHTKYYSGSNVSFSHDTEGGEANQAQVS